MAAEVELDVGKLEIISDGGFIHHQMLRLYQNIRLAFLGRTTPASLIPDILAQVNVTLFEEFCPKSTADAQGDWSDAFRWFTDGNYNCHTFGDVLATLLMHRMPFLPSMRPSLRSYNGLDTAVIRGKILLTLLALKISPIPTYGLVWFCSLPEERIKSS